MYETIANFYLNKFSVDVIWIPHYDYTFIRDMYSHPIL